MATSFARRELRNTSSHEGDGMPDIYRGASLLSRFIPRDVDGSIRRDVEGNAWPARPCIAFGHAVQKFLLGPWLRRLCGEKFEIRLVTMVMVMSDINKERVGYSSRINRRDGDRSRARNAMLSAMLF